MSNQSLPAASENWKANPVIVAIIAGAAGYGFCYQFTMPTHTQALRNEIVANAELAMKAKATEERASAKSKDEDEKRSLLERQLKDALVKGLEQSNLFSLGNPYPVGLGLVKIGQSVDDLEKAYPGAKIEKSSRYWSLMEFHSVFTDVTYYFEEGTAGKKITFIYLRTSGRARNDGNFLQNKLLEVLGPPTDVPVANFASWDLAAFKLAVYFDPLVVAPSYTIMREGYTPIRWPRKVAPPVTGATSPKK